MNNVCRIDKLGNGDLYPEVQEVGTKIVLLAFESVLEFDCAALQQESPVHIDIMQNDEGKMVEGLKNGDKYVANIDIPAARYEYQPGVEEDSVEKVQVPFTKDNLSAVKVTLWEISPVQTGITISE